LPNCRLASAKWQRDNVFFVSTMGQFIVSGFTHFLPFPLCAGSMMFWADSGIVCNEVGVLVAKGLHDTKKFPSFLGSFVMRWVSLGIARH
jgi:hypothetical protein